MIRFEFHRFCLLSRTRTRLTAAVEAYVSPLITTFTLGLLTLTLAFVTPNALKAQVETYSATFLTEHQGGPGGAEWSDLTCSGPIAGNWRLAGVRVRYGAVVDEMHALCTRVSEDGLWLDTPLMTGSAGTNNPSPGVEWTSVQCSQHHYLTAFRTYLRPHAGSSEVVARIQIRCRPAQSDLTPTTADTETQTGGAEATGGDWSSEWITCPQTHPFAHGVRTFSGFYVDRMHLHCAAPLAPAPPTVAPVIVAPKMSDDYPASSYVDFREFIPLVFEAVGDATHYRVCLKRMSDATGCHYERAFGPEEVISGGELRVINLQLPEASGYNVFQLFEGSSVFWTVRACSAPHACGPSAPFEVMSVLPRPPTLVAPEHQASASSRCVRFRWNTTPHAQSNRTFIQGEGATGFNFQNPLWSGAASFYASGNVRSRWIYIGKDLGNSVRWQTRSCRRYPNFIFNWDNSFASPEAAGWRCNFGQADRVLSLPNATVEDDEGRWRCAEINRAYSGCEGSYNYRAQGGPFGRNRTVSFKLENGETLDGFVPSLNWIYNRGEGLLQVTRTVNPQTIVLAGGQRDPTYGDHPLGTIGMTQISCLEPRLTALP